MSGLFSAPATPAAPPLPPAPPNAANSTVAMDEAQLATAQRLQAGRSATILTGGGGLQAGQMGTTSKTLLGQ